MLSLLAPSPMLGGDGIGVDELGIIIVIILLLPVLIFGSLSWGIAIILFPFTILVVIILISLLDIVEGGCYVDAQSQPMMVGDSFEFYSLLSWSRGSSRAQVWGIRLFALSCSQFRGRVSPRFSYVSQLQACYGMPLGVKNGVLAISVLQAPPRELGGMQSAPGGHCHLLGGSLLFGHFV